MNCLRSAARRYRRGSPHHPEDAERVRAWRTLGDELHRRYGGVVDEPVPQRLDLDRLVTRPRTWVWSAIAATFLAFMVGSGAGWMAHNAWATEISPTEALRDEAITAHKLYTGEVRHPVEVTSSEQEHLLSWLSRRVGTTLRAPDLTKYDLKLLGGRLLPGLSGPAALFMYENGSSERVTLYCTPVKAPTTTLIYKDVENHRLRAVDRERLRLGRQRSSQQGPTQGRGHGGL